MGVLDRYHHTLSQLFASAPVFLLLLKTVRQKRSRWECMGYRSSRSALIRYRPVLQPVSGCYRPVLYTSSAQSNGSGFTIMSSRVCIQPYKLKRAVVGCCGSGVQARGCGPVLLQQPADKQILFYCASAGLPSGLRPVKFVLQ